MDKNKDRGVPYDIVAEWLVQKEYRLLKERRLEDFWAKELAKHQTQERENMTEEELSKIGISERVVDEMGHWQDPNYKYDGWVPEVWEGIPKFTGDK
jgi:hypothetical protein